MKKNYVLKLEGKEWKELINKSFEKKKKDLKVDGFRKGLVPFDVYVKKFGIESLYMDAADLALPTLYSKLLNDEKDLEPACMPTVDIKGISEEHVEVEFAVITKPEVKLGKYKDLNVKKHEVEVSNEEIEHELFHLKEQFIELKIKEDGVVENSNEVILDFEGFKDGVAFDGGKATDYNLVIGSHSFIPGFEEGLLGMKKGEEKDLTLNFPQDYPAEELKGKEVLFKVKIKEIKERIEPEMNDDFFKDLNLPEVNSIDGLKEEIKNNIKTHKSRDVENAYVEECLGAVVKNSKFDVPEEMVLEEVNRMTSEFREQVKMQGLELEQYLEMIKSSLQELQDTFKEEAKKRVEFRLVIEAVAKQEKIEVNDKEVDEYTKELATRYSLSEEEFIKNIGGKDLLKYDLEFKKALDIITK